MSKDLIAAGNALAATLEAENAALAALDLPRAVGMLADKQRAVADVAAADPVRGPRHEAAERMAHRLRGLALENKRLLERAITVQRRVMGVVALAASSAAPTGYGRPRKDRVSAFALSARV